MRILEVGCGLGGLIELLEDKHPRWEISGVEISDYALKKCREKGVDVLKADAEHLPFDDDSFDYVVSQHLLEHVEWRKALEESLRVAGRGVIHILPGHPTIDRNHRIDYFTGEMIEEMVKKLIERGYDARAYAEGDPSASDWVLEIYHEESG